MFRKKKSPFVEINFARKEKKRLFTFSFNFKKFLEAERENYFLYALSLLSFVGIFVALIATNQFIKKQKEDIENLRKEIADITIQIASLKKQVQAEERKFSQFYIENLKEKLLIVLLGQSFNLQTAAVVQQFRSITGGLNAYTGFVVYPNIYTNFAANPPSLKDLSKRVGTQYVIFTEMFGENGNPFNVSPGKEQTLGVPVVLNPTVYIKAEKTDSKFESAIQSIKDETLKANIRLQYLLIKKGLSNLSYKIPETLIFPINMIFPTGVAYTTKLKELENFCNAFYINRSYTEKRFYNNEVHVQGVIDGICIKNVY